MVVVCDQEGGGGEPLAIISKIGIKILEISVGKSL